MKYLFYDVETANASKRGSICAVGWVQVVDNEIVDKGYTLIDPQCSFSVKNVEIHGITKAQVKGAPTFAQYWHSCLLEKVSGALIVSHNAIFDISATEQALANAGLQDPGLLYMDSLPVARRCLQMDHYRLSNLADEFGWQYHSHNALEDAEALAYVLLRLTARQGYDSLAQLFLFSCCAPQSSLDNSYQPVQHCPHEETEPVDNRLCGVRICITGDIPGIERDDVEQMIAAHGGRPTSCVSGKTDYLVVGTYDDYGPDFISGKHRKALDLIETGGKIKIITPAELTSMLSGSPEES